jgi:ketosteroid isomerase-like protein
MRVVSMMCGGLLVALAACQKAETPQQAATRMQQETDSARTAVQAMTANWSRWTAAGQADSIAGLFVDQGYELPPNAPPVHGRDAIKAFEAQDASLGQITLDLSVDDVAANGPVASARGAYEFTLQPGAGAPTGMTALADTGKWVGTLRQEGGQWQFTAVIWNSNRPLPPPAPAAPARRK